MNRAPSGSTPDSVAEETTKVVATLEAQVKRDYAPPRVKRDAHPKMHGCVQAELVVDPQIPSHLRHGVFTTPGTRYRAWIRFSNAFHIEHDLKFGPRGMAIKLLDVPGDTPWSDEARTQDFLLATHDAFFLPDEKGYNEFAKAAGNTPPTVFAFFRRRRLWNAYFQMLRSSFVLARNPLAIRFFSQTPYQFGPHVVKIQARPSVTTALGDQLPATWWFWCQVIIANLVMRPSQSSEKQAAAETWCERHFADRNLLRLAMMSFLAEHEASFDFLVQRRIDSPRMPIDDATRRWPESLSAYEKVATITIPRQVFWPQPGFTKTLAEATNEMMELGENMSFNPWHAIEAHEPLGSINLMRRRIYPAIVSLRRGLNRVGTPDPAAAYDRLKPIIR